MEINAGAIGIYREILVIIAAYITILSLIDLLLSSNLCLPNPNLEILLTEGLEHVYHPLLACLGDLLFRREVLQDAGPRLDKAQDLFHS